jgi:hypothetical protein
VHCGRLSPLAGERPVVRRARCLPIGFVQTVPGLCSCSVPTHVALDYHATQRQLARAARPPRFHKVGAPLFEWGRCAHLDESCHVCRRQPLAQRPCQRLQQRVRGEQMAQASVLNSRAHRQVGRRLSLPASHLTQRADRVARLFGGDQLVQQQGVALELQRHSTWREAGCEAQERPCRAHTCVTTSTGFCSSSTFLVASVAMASAGLASAMCSSAAMNGPHESKQRCVASVHVTRHVQSRVTLGESRDAECSAATPQHRASGAQKQ